ncbi:MAG: aminotransferase class III-fold pyridoxal phosphate-dependent enzyme [Acidimicrobiia bacterium]|nr:aminotransferase class III-fold pyridoxal phosphate-dependent enzyme [Acidimicrobiia bacterium]
MPRQGPDRRVPADVGHRSVESCLRRVPRRGPERGDLLPRALLRGNALAAAVALRHLQLIDELGVLANVEERAAQLRRRLDADVVGRSDVAAVRRHGLMCGVELAPPAADLRWGRRVCAAAVRRGVLLRPLGDVVIVMPPLTITDDEIDRIADVLADAIDEISHEPVVR